MLDPILLKKLSRYKLKIKLMNYIKFSFKTTEELKDILIAELGQNANFEMFEEDDNQEDWSAFIREGDFDESIFDEIIEKYKKDYKIDYKSELVLEQNWNAVWESNFEMVEIGEDVVVYAPFHNLTKKFKYELLIQPKMSFGTGHHATTTLMMEYILKTDLVSKSVLDFGCGTSILAILALKREANPVYAVENSLENCNLNNASAIEVKLGDITIYPKDKTFDVILGNITKNTIISFIEDISIRLKKDGLFFCSGFYEQDIEDLKVEALKTGLQFIESKTLNQWSCIKFTKSL